MSTRWVFVAMLLLAGRAAWAADAPAGEVNVALRKWGLATARASSIYGPGYEADNVLDGRWRVRETDKWNSAANALPHWLIIDLGRETTINRIVIRHEGVIGQGDQYNTSDFRLQRGAGADGPWTDLVEPVRNNHQDVTTHTFPPARTRYVRLFIEKGEQSANVFGRILEVEVYAPVGTLPGPLVALDWASPRRYRKVGNDLQQLAAAEMAAAPGMAKASGLRLEVNGAPAADLADWNGAGTREFWAPVKPAGVEVSLTAAGANGRTAVARRKLFPAGGDYFCNGGTIGIISSSHQDYAWMDNPQACIGYRDTACITPALEMMAKDKNYCFVMENMINLREYLERHPDRRDEIAKLTREGRLEWGATYNQPYEALLSGEELVRETYFGRRWLRKTLPGCDARVAFNPDVPGRSLQMQQILSKAGIPYLVISRYHQGIYHWNSPDGTGVIAYTPGHYCNDSGLLNAAPAAAVPAISRRLDQQGAYYRKREIPPALCLYNSVDFSRPTDFNPLITLWNAPRPGDDNLLAPPKMQYSSAKGWFDAIARGAQHLDTICGERPDVWMYIGGPTHHWAIAAKREAAELLPAAETFQTVRAWLDGSFSKYPAQRLSEAWRAEILPDHGWGGKDGYITDILFKNTSEFARDEGRQILDDAARDIAGRVKTNPARGKPVVCFNALSWKRSDPVVVDLPDERPYSVLDPTGKEVRSQITTAEEPDEVNVAAASAGAKATADSSAGPAFGPEKAIDGQWSRLDTDRWVSGPGAGPHWLVVDFGRPRTVHRVVIRHEGSLGAFRDEEAFNTSDFQLQSGDGPDGPWADLLPPVAGNKDVLTTHDFPARTFRYLRLLVTKGGAKEGEPARIFEILAYEKNTAKRRKLLFTAQDVPSVGYKTYTLAAGKASPPAKSGPWRNVYENAFYRIELAPGGIRQIRDKALGRDLLATDKFLGGEVFTMQSVGNGAGEFGAVQQPTMEGFDKLSLHKPAWKLLESGPVRTVFALEQPLPDCTVQERVALYNQVKRIDFEVSLLQWNGRKWREFRMALPLNMPKGKVAYEVPMGVVEIGKDELPTTGGLAYGSLNYYEKCADIRPREVQRFVSASDDRAGVTLSSCVAVFDYRDPTPNPVSYPVLQPVLLASRKSCHGEGNWYLQPGDHFYRFSLTSHAPGWRNGYRTALQACAPLLPVLAAGGAGSSGRPPARTGSLPAERSFLSFSAGNVLLSTLKKSEDDDSAVLRCYDMEGKDSRPAIRAFVPFARAEHTNIIEEDGKPLPVAGGALRLPVGHHAIETVKLTAGKGG